MGGVHKYKARRSYVCAYCGEPIDKGNYYYNCHGKPWCLDCALGKKRRPLAHVIRFPKEEGD